GVGFGDWESNGVDELGSSCCVDVGHAATCSSVCPHHCRTSLSPFIPTQFWLAYLLSAAAIISSSQCFQVVGIEGHNPSGHCLVASKLVDSIPPTSVADDKDLNPAKKLAIDKSQPIDITSKKTELPMASGLCPQSLSNIEGLTLVDLSYNNLSGSLPRIPARTLNLVLQTNQELDHDEKLNRVIVVYRDQRIIGANCKVIDGEVDIWEQRIVFGSRAKNLKDLMLAEEAPTPLQFSKKRSRSGSLKIVKRDSCSIKL
ncbi:hypothetical protein S83_066427, partial [Arachis hypogaea]